MDIRPFAIDFQVFHCYKNAGSPYERMFNMYIKYL